MTPTALHTYLFSPTGTSRRIAEAIARGLAGGDIPRRLHDLTRPAAAAPESAPEESALPGSAPAGRAAAEGNETPPAAPDTPAPLPAAEEGAAALFVLPVYGGHPAPVALRRLETLRGTDTPAVVVAVYGNRAFEGAAAELARFVEARGFRVVAAAGFVGEHSYSSDRYPIAAGRPDREDLAAAEAFGGAVRRKLRDEGPRPVEVARLHDRPAPLLSTLRFIRFVLGYRRRQRRHPQPLLPRCDRDRCTGCGACAARCPVQAIPEAEPWVTDPARCIRCCACVKGCAAAARSFDTPFAAALARNFTRRKEPVTLL